MRLYAFGQVQSGPDMHDGQMVMNGI
jgi:hypothetical protein